MVGHHFDFLCNGPVFVGCISDSFPPPELRMFFFLMACVVCESLFKGRFVIAPVTKRTFLFPPQPPDCPCHVCGDVRFFRLDSFLKDRPDQAPSPRSASSLPPASLIFCDSSFLGSGDHAPTSPPIRAQRQGKPLFRGGSLSFSSTVPKFVRVRLFFTPFQPPSESL